MSGVAISGSTREPVMVAPGFLPADWPVHPAIRAVVSTRAAPGRSLPPYDRCNLGARSGDELATVLGNRAALAGTLALPSHPVWLQQVHGTGVSMVHDRLTAPRAIDHEPVSDAAVTSTPGVVLAVLSADCLPVLFAADDGSVIAAAHAGWRGLLAGVLERTLEAMAIAAPGISAWLGPAIGARSYEVGDEVRDAFVADSTAAAACFTATRAGHWTCDLYALARLRLSRAGVACIHGGGFDTFADAVRFHSHRRDGARSGRQASLVWLDPAGS